MSSLDPFRSVDMATRKLMWSRAGYTPQPYQATFHEAMWPKRKATGGGIGAAKTLTTVQDYAHEALAAAHRFQQGYGGADGYNGRIGIVAATYQLCQVAFDYLLKIWQANGLIEGEPSRPLNRQWRMVSTTGVEVLTISANDVMTFAAKPYTVVHIPEAMQTPEELFSAAIERTSRWPGPHAGMVYLEGTFEKLGYPWYVKTCKTYAVDGNLEEGKYFSFPSWENRYNFPGGFEDDKIQDLLKHYRNIGKEDDFFVRVGGQIPKQQSDLWSEHFVPARHVKPLSFDPALPVDFAFDPATHKYAGLFMQWPDDRNLYILDELVIRQASFLHYRNAFLATPYAKNISKRSLVATDVAALRHDRGMDSTYEMWQKPIDKGGLGVKPQYKYLHLNTGLEVLMTGLSGQYYHVHIDPKCQDLLMNFREETRNDRGELDHIQNHGKDDSRKALSYYLALKKGTGLGRPERRRLPQLPSSITISLGRKEKFAK